jgi:hypothetical protein
LAANFWKWPDAAVAGIREARKQSGDKLPSGGRFKMTGADVDSHAIAIQSSESDQAGRRGTIAIGVNVYTDSPC